MIIILLYLQVQKKRKETCKHTSLNCPPNASKVKANTVRLQQSLSLAATGTKKNIITSVLVCGQAC